MNELNQSRDTLKAAELAQGAKLKASAKNAPNSDKCATDAKPCPAAAATASAPKIKTGVYNGNTSRETKTPPPRTPSVSAAGIAPIKLKIGVPSKSDATRVPMALVGNAICTAKSGAKSASGRPVSTQ